MPKSHIRTVLIILLTLLLLLEINAVNAQTKPGPTQPTTVVKEKPIQEIITTEKNNPTESGEACSDGTLNKHCSTQKPFQCLGGKLETSCVLCGCDNNLICTPTKTCESTSWPAINTGERKLLVLMAKFQDSTINRQCGLANVELIKDQIFNENNSNSINSWIQKISYEKTWLTGDVYGWINVPITEYDGGCNNDRGKFENVIRVAAEIADPEIDFSQYEMIFLIPSCTETIASGDPIILQTDEGTFTFPFFASGNTCELPVGTTIHEFGHKLGHGHAKFLNCGTESVGDDCEKIEYGDLFDVQGGNRNDQPGPFNAYYRERNGWLEPNQIKEITESGTYIIEPLSTHTTGIKALKIPGNGISLSTVYNGAPANQYDNLSYYIEYRRNVSEYFNLLDKTTGQEVELQYNKGGIIRLAGGLISDTFSNNKPNINTLLIDATPGNTVDLIDVALQEGQTFRDEKHGISITTLTANENELTVRVTLENEDITQKENGEPCKNDSECKSNLCRESQCAKIGIWQRIIAWFKRLFS